MVLSYVSGFKRNSGIQKYQRQIRYLNKSLKQSRISTKCLKTRLREVEKTIREQSFQDIIKNMTIPAKIFTKMQYRETSKKHKGRRFSLDEKVLSLSLYKRSPKAYSLFSNYFTLPSAKTLKRLLSGIHISPGINHVVFKKIKTITNKMSINDRLCSLIFDEMYITPQIHYDGAKDALKGFSNHGKKNIADHALVFMVKGLKAKFKQPVAYYFTNSLNKIELKNIIVEVIKEIQKSGLIVLCTVCDQSAINVSAINSLVQETKDFLKNGKEWSHDFYEINKKQIIPLFDVPHLIKGLRNNLITKNMQYKDFSDNCIKQVKWDYFQMLYRADKSYGELRLLHKITEEHVNPEKIKKMRVKLATQIFSHSVAVATEHLSARGDLPQECRQLIPVTLLLDDLFDSLNVSSFHIQNGKKYKGAVKRNSPHHQLWQNAIKTLETIKFIRRKITGAKIQFIETTVPSTKNFIKTIQGMQALWKILSKKYSFDSMLTRNFNQDPIENFFGNIRSYGARNVSPNCIGFESAFKALLLNNYNTPHSIKANCEEDTDPCLSTLDFFLQENFINKSDITSDVSNTQNIKFDYELIQNSNLDVEIIGDVGQCNYVCGWVLTKCLKTVVKSCKCCKQDLIYKGQNSKNDYIKAKEYSKKQWLCYPNQKIEKAFFEIQKVINSFLTKDVPLNNLKQNVKIISNELVEFPFNCRLHRDDLKNTFMNYTINVIVYSWCRTINRILSGKVSYDGDDEIKMAAQLYYNKHRNKKKLT